jgi:hypothetical protein
MALTAKPSAPDNGDPPSQEASLGDLLTCSNTECNVGPGRERLPGRRSITGEPPAVFSLGLVWNKELGAGARGRPPRDAQPHGSSRCSAPPLTSTLCFDKSVEEAASRRWRGHRRRILALARLKGGRQGQGRAPNSCACVRDPCYVVFFRFVVIDRICDAFFLVF